MKRMVLAKRQTATKAPPRGKAASREPARTASRILNAATREFAHHGYQGARTERIVAKARCNMRMLYHYYGSKEGLYLAVLESIYGNIREKERKLALDHLAPVADARVGQDARVQPVELPQGLPVGQPGCKAFSGSLKHGDLLDHSGLQYRPAQLGGESAGGEWIFASCRGFLLRTGVRRAFQE